MEVRQKVKDAVRKHGVPRVQKALGLSRYGVLTLCTDGAKPHDGTIAQATLNQSALDALDTETHPPPRAA